MLYIHGLQTSLFGAEATWEDWGPNSEDHPCAPYIALDHEVLSQSSTILAMLVENPTALRCSKVTTSESGARNFGCIQSHHSRLFDRLPILFMSPFLPLVYLPILVFPCLYSLSPRSVLRALRKIINSWEEWVGCLSWDLFERLAVCVRTCAP